MVEFIFFACKTELIYSQFPSSSWSYNVVACPKHLPYFRWLALCLKH